MILIPGGGVALWGKNQLLCALKATWLSGLKFIEWQLRLGMWYTALSIVGFAGWCTVVRMEKSTFVGWSSGILSSLLLRANISGEISDNCKWFFLNGWFFFHPAFQCTVKLWITRDWPRLLLILKLKRYIRPPAQDNSSRTLDNLY